MLKISKAALAAAVLSLSAVPAVGLVQSVAQETHAANTPDTHAAMPVVSIPTITLVDSSMSEADFRDLLTNGTISTHAKDLAALTATSITIPEIKVTITVPPSPGEEQMTTDITVNDLVLGNVKNGVAESAKIGSITTGNP